MSSSASTVDIDDQGTFAPADPNDLIGVNHNNNYRYDEIGNLVRDDQENISQIEWTVYGKIKKIIRTTSSGKDDLEFKYDAGGNRVAKIVKPDGSSVENGGSDNPALWITTYYLRDAQGNILATYEDNDQDANFYLDEQNIYGSSRLGNVTRGLNLTPSSPPLACAICPVYFENTRGKKNYEMTNHLGNVLTTINDSREAIPNGNQNDYFKAVITSVTDYYPFGMNMPGRSYTPPAGSEYRFGFNGKENDNEVKGNGNQQDYGFRIYDPRLAKFLSVDPLTKEYPWYTPYQFAGNKPIQFIDLDGLEEAKPTINTSNNAISNTKTSSCHPPSQDINPVGGDGRSALSKLAAFGDVVDNAMKGNHRFKPSGNEKISFPFGISGIEFKKNSDEKTTDPANKTTGPVVVLDYEEFTAIETFVAVYSTPATKGNLQEQLTDERTTGRSNRMEHKGSETVLGQTGDPNIERSQTVIQVANETHVQYIINNSPDTQSYAGGVHKGEKYAPYDTVSKITYTKNPASRQWESHEQKYPPR